MYSNSNAVYRADLSGYVFETASWEDALIADKVLPVVTSMTKDGQYPKFKKKTGKLLKRGVKARAPYGAYPRDTTAFEQETFQTQDWGHEQAVDDSVSADVARFFDAEVVATKLARRKVLLDKEVRAAAAIFNTTNFGTATNSATAYTVANLATFDVGLDIDGIRDALVAKGEFADTAVIPYQVATRLRASTKFQNRARGVGVSSDTILRLDEGAIAEVLGLDKVFIARAAYDSAGEGADFSSSLIWANTYIWVGKTGTAGGVETMLEGGAAYTIAWSQYGDALTVETYRDETHKSDIVRAYQHVAEKVVNGEAGALLATQYA